MKMEHPVMFIISVILQIVFFAFGAYYFTISLFAWFNKKEKPLLTDKTYSFALVVAAHNEAAVIENMVESLLSLDYPREAYDVFVIADNCTDNTAELARNAGALVYERENKTERGKGFALEWMFAKLYEMDKKYDSIAIFDADNIVDKNFLKEMNKKHQQGFEVVQGYIDSKNPFDSWITSAYTISFWAVNKLFQYSRYNLNLSCQLCGTGFAILTDVLRKIGWQATCLTEDMEFTMKLVLNDYKVSYAKNAVVYDEKPLTFSQSWKQRVRWMQGHSDVASRFVGPLLRKAIVEKKWSPVDCAVYLLQPVRILMMGLITMMCWIQTAYPTGDIGFFQISYIFPSPILWYLFVTVQFLYTPLVIWLEKRKLNFKLIWLYMTYFFYSLTWVPITVIGIINKNKKEWFHTQHTRKISIKEVN
ncbi:MAG: glycosyltransferase family 2 protein [Clostridia bacterium]|nr:glycosyltransferase family 2 protein [Clostridia bacterium]